MGIRTENLHLPHNSMQETISLLFDDAVTLAGDCLQTRSIANLDHAPTIADEFFSLKIAGGHIDALTPHAQYVGHELLREPKLI